MSLEKMKEAVAGLVAESFKATLDEAVEHRLSIFESKEEELEDDEDDEDDEEEESDDEDDEEEEEELKEAMKVTAKPIGSKNSAPPEEFEVKDMRELTKIAKTGKYGWMMVTKRNGDEDEYIVEKGKLVLM